MTLNDKIAIVNDFIDIMYDLQKAIDDAEDELDSLSPTGDKSKSIQRLNGVKDNLAYIIANSFGCDYDALNPKYGPHELIFTSNTPQDKEQEMPKKDCKCGKKSDEAQRIEELEQEVRQLRKSSQVDVTMIIEDLIEAFEMAIHELHKSDDVLLQDVLKGMLASLDLALFAQWSKEEAQAKQGRPTTVMQRVKRNQAIDEMVLEVHEMAGDIVDLLEMEGADKHSMDVAGDVKRAARTLASERINCDPDAPDDPNVPRRMVAACGEVIESAIPL